MTSLLHMHHFYEYRSSCLEDGKGLKWAYCICRVTKISDESKYTSISNDSYIEFNYDRYVICARAQLWCFFIFNEYLYIGWNTLELINKAFWTSRIALLKHQILNYLFLFQPSSIICILSCQNTYICDVVHMQGHTFS